MIRLLASLLGLATIGFGAAAIWGGGSLYLPILCIAVGAVLLVADGTLGAKGSVPTVMRFLIGLFSLAFLALAVVDTAGKFSLFPDAAVPFLPQPGSAIIAAIFAIVHLLICYIPVVRRIIDMANPFFESEDMSQIEMGYFGTWPMQLRKLGLGLFAVIIILNVFLVYLLVRFNYWSNTFYTSLQEKNAPVFWTQLGVFTVLATAYILRGMLQTYLIGILKLHWREWLSRRYIGQWLSDKVHYRLGLDRTSTDNPDQRISEDVRDFTDQSFDFYINIFATSLNLYAFIQILWGISAQFPYKIGSFDLSSIPGYLVWMVLIFAIFITFLTHLVGRPLVALQFRAQKVEADFRYNLVRVRENSEQIALLHGEPVEQTGLMRRFGSIFDTLLAILYRQLKLTVVTLGYAQLNVILPFLLLGPAYFATESMKFGDLQQTAGAFGNVQDAVSFFITSYASLAVFKSIVDRLATFDRAIEQADLARIDGVQVVGTGTYSEISGNEVDIRLPTGKALLEKIGFSIKKAQRTLVTGPTGAGKTTLFRAIAGIWPYGRGSTSLPRGDSVMLLPQQPYFPLGTLGSALAYPSDEHTFSKIQLAEALSQVGLSEFSGKIDTSDNWSSVLSGGEKQRVALARAILHKPNWLLLDEATSAMGEHDEAALYGLLRAALPDSTIVSIGHRTSLAALHDRRLEVTKNDLGSRIDEAPLAAFGV